MPNLGIVSYESFFSMIDKDVEGRSTRELTVKYDQQYVQVFQAKSNSIENIFFMSNVKMTSDGVNPNASDLKIDIVNVTASGDTFTLGGSIVPTITAEDCVRLGRNSNESSDDSYWYTYNTKATVTSGQYYGVVFSSDNTNSTTKIYFTENYRDDVFPMILSSTSGASPNWSNSLFTSGSELFGGVRKGSICCGFLGNTIEDSGYIFDSGSLNIGGGDARRGYEVYLYVVKTDSDVSIKFTQSSPDSSADGSPEETNRASMSWYWYSEGTLPISNNSSLLKDTSVAARLEGSASFALFTQPDKFAPYPKLYFPEIEVNLKNKSIDINMLGQGYRSRPVEGVSVNDKYADVTGAIKDNSNNFSPQNWAHFSEEKKTIVISETGLRSPSESVNPNFIDFSLEKESEDVEQVFKKTLNSSERDYIRGYNNVVKFDGKYIAFSKYKTSYISLITGTSAVPAVMSGIPIITADDLDSDTWSDKTMTITGAGTNNTLRGAKYIGVHDAIVRNTASGETLFLTLQVIPPERDDVNNPDAPYFALAYATEIDSGTGNISLTQAECDNYKPSDARFGCAETKELIRTDDWLTISGSSTISSGIIILNSIGTTVLQCVDAPAGKEYILRIYSSHPGDTTISLGNGASYTMSVFTENVVLIPKDSTGILKITSSAGDITINSLSLIEATTRYNLSDNIMPDPYLGDSSFWTLGSWVSTNDSTGPYGSYFSLPMISGTYPLIYNSSNVTLLYGKVYRLVFKVSGMEEAIANGYDPKFYIESSYSGVKYSHQESALGANSPYGFMEYGFLMYNLSGTVSGSDNIRITASIGSGSGGGEIKIHSVMLFEVENTVDVDYKSAKFIDSPDNQYLLLTALNNGYNGNGYQGEYSGGKFGLWKIDLDASSGGAFTVTSDTVSEVFSERGFRSYSGINARDRETEITYVCNPGSGDIYYGTSTEGDTLSYGYAIGYDYDPHGYIAEVFAMDTLNDIREIISGDRSQYWLLGITSGGGDVVGYHDTPFPADDTYRYTSRPHYYVLNRNTKVAFMTKVDDVLHVWMTQYMRYHNYGHPLHIAIDLKTNIPRVLRRFPIDGNGDTVDGSSSPPSWGVSGLETTSIDNIVIGGISENTTSKLLCDITGGIDSGDYVYISGMGPDSTVGGAMSHDSAKWLIYDKRIINHAYEYGIIDSSEYIVISSSAVGSYNGASDSESNFVKRDQFASISSGNKKYGYYDGISIGRYYYSPTQLEVYDYPYHKISATEPRVGIYCGSVVAMNDAGSYVDGSFFDRFIDSRYDTNPRLIEQNGIVYLVCDNHVDGSRIYKTYGLKQSPIDWGIADRVVGTPGFDLDLEKSIEIKCSGVHSNTMRGVSISSISGTNFVSGMRRNVDIQGVTTYDDGIRNIGRFTCGIDKPQNLSFFYQFNYLRANMDLGEYYEGTTTPITTYVIDKLSSTGYMNLVLKTAPTYEKLWTEPSASTKIPFELAYSSSVMPQPDYVGRYYCHHTFQTDISDVFYRIESVELATPHDEDFQIEGKTLGSENYYNGGVTDGDVAVPYAEILIKGLTLSDVDLPAEDEGLDQKTIAINGIVNSGSPEAIVDGGIGAEVTGSDEIVVDFPAHIFLNEISFDIVVNDNIIGDSNSQFDLYYLSQSNINQHNINVVSDSDWIDMGSINFDPSDYNVDELNDGVNVKIDAINIFAKSFRIYVNSGLKFKIKNLKLKTFATAGTATQFNKGNGVGNAELIIIDDVHGLISGKYSSDVDVASYAEFKKENSYVEIDLGALLDEDGNQIGDGEIPINKISMNVSAGLGRSIKVQTKTRVGSYEDVYDERILDYEYTLVEWTPREKTKSNIVDIVVSKTSGTVSNLGDLDPYSSSNNRALGVSSNYSQYFDSGALRGYLFRPSYLKSRNVSIINSDSATGDYEGTLQFNAQMDENGPFGSDQGTVGVIERCVQIEFPVQDVEKVKVIAYGFESQNQEPVRINGFKVYTPIVGSDGIAVWPKADITWDIVLRAQTISSV